MNLKWLYSILIFLPAISIGQIINTVAGTGVAGYSGDGGPAISAQLSSPSHIYKDAAGNIYISDYGNNCVRKINTSGIISTIAGTGIGGFSGDGGPATLATFNNPQDIFVDTGGNIFITDYLNHRIRKISTTGIVSTFAGTGANGYSGDGGMAVAAKFSYPQGICGDANGNIYIADANNSRIRKVNASGIITTIAGNGSGGFSGDGGAATAAGLFHPFGICFDTLGNLYIADQSNNRIRKVDTSGVIITIAGNGIAGFGGDGFAATAANINTPSGVSADAWGNVYIADQQNNRIRKINPSGIITTIAGTGSYGFGGDGGNATAAMLRNATGVFVDTSGTILISDFSNHRIRFIHACTNSITAHPANDTVFAGDSAKYWITTSLTAPNYQWQQNAGFGFVNLANAWPYSGVTTDTLIIHNASLFIDNTTYRCVVTNGSLCSDTSMSAILRIISPTGLTKQNTDLIWLYPNPAHNYVTIKLPYQISYGTISIIDQLGKTVEMQNIDNNTKNIDISRLSSGMYNVKILYNETVVYRRIFKD